MALHNKKFKTLQDEINWWKSLSLKERKAIIQKSVEKDNERKVKSELIKMDNYLKSGKRTY